MTEPVEFDDPPFPQQWEPYRHLVELWVRALRDGWDSIPDSEIDRHFLRADARVMLRALPPQARWGTLNRLLEYEEVAEGRVTVIWEDHAGVSLRTGFSVTEDTPFRIGGFNPRSNRTLPPGFTVRPAEESDGPTLRLLDRRAPIRVEDSEVAYDHGDDYFGAIRLMAGPSVTLVLEHDGRVIGVNCMTHLPVRIGGVLMQANYNYRTRIDPDFGGQGLSLGFASRAPELMPRAHLGFGVSYIARGNERMERAAMGFWSVEPERLLIKASPLAGAHGFRRCSEDDAARIVELLNTTHDGEEMFVPYTLESLAARVSREPAMYAWNDFRVSDAAVIGVGRLPMTVFRSDSGNESEHNRGVVYDYGFESGREDSLAGLVRGVCAETLDSFTELSLFSSGGSPGYAALKALAYRAEAYNALVNRPEPPGVAEHGFYVDQLTF